MKTRILIVDDEPNICTTLALIAEAQGYRVRYAQSGSEALAIAESFRPDLLLTDYAMPGMDGFELATRVSRMLPGCRLYMLTAFADLSGFPRQPRQPNLTVLVKPLHPARLFEALAQPQFTLTSVNPKILNVDDNEMHRYSISRLLKQRGFNVLEATCASEALTKVADSDAVLLDINMPDMNGFMVCRHIRERSELRNLPIVHFTASYGDEDGPEKSRDAGADEYFEQPVEPDVLIARLRELVQRKYNTTASADARGRESRN